MQESANRYPGLPASSLCSGDAGVFVSADAGLEREFEARLQESSALAVRVAFSVLRQRQDAEDVAQEAFARAFRRFASLRDPEAFRRWIVRVTWRLAIDRWRADRRRRAREEVANVQPVAADAEEAASAAGRAARLWECIDALPEKLRIVIVLSAIEGHGVQEVAGLLDIPPGTVKSRLFLARRALAEKLRCLANNPEG